MQELLCCRVETRSTPVSHDDRVKARAALLQVEKRSTDVSYDVKSQCKSCLAAELRLARQPRAMTTESVQELLCYRVETHWTAVSHDDRVSAGAALLQG